MKERKYVLDAIDSTFISSVGQYVTLFEEMIKTLTGSKNAVATVNGTSALHIALLLAGAKNNDLVITQPVTFVSTCNAISYVGASPVFVDVDLDTLSLSPEKLISFLKKETHIDKNGYCVHSKSQKKIKAVLPMHTFGHPARMDEIIEIAQKYHLKVIEDAAESIGSYYKGRHTGALGDIGIFSFNGNKTLTCGGGGVLITNDDNLAKEAKHLTTQAKVNHPWEMNHDKIGYNYRMPNLNAAFACGQIEMLDTLLERQRNVAMAYMAFFETKNIRFFHEPVFARSNYWLNAIALNNIEERNQFLSETNNKGIMTRPLWKLMHKLPMFKNSLKTDLSNAEQLESVIVNIPSSAI